MNLNNMATCAAVMLIAICSADAGVLDIDNDIQTYSSLTDTTVNMTGRSELHLTSSTSPLINCQVNLNSSDAWLFLTGLKPSAVNTSTYLNQIYVNGTAAVLDSNIRIVQYATGAVVIPHGPGYQPLEVFSSVNFAGSSMDLGLYTYYQPVQLGGMDDAIRSFRLKRGYMATFAEESDGTGISRVYIADERDLEIGVMPADMDNVVSFVRVFPWHWTTQKGWAGGNPDGAGIAPDTLNCSWRYNWSNNANSTLDVEYVPIKQHAGWPSYDGINSRQTVTHLLGFNEPDRPDQADMTVGEAIAQWPNLMESGLRLGSPAPSDGGLDWLYSFIDQADALNYRVDFVAVHYYKNNWTADQMENWLWNIHQRTGRPLWITEFNNGCNWTSPDPSYQQNADKVEELITRLASLPYVERYSYYNWCTNRQLFYPDGSGLTPAGIVYRDHVSPMAVALEPNKECIGYYKLDAPTGTTATDLSGRQMDGTLQNGLSFDNDSVPGMPGYALHFDGVDDCIKLPAGYDEFDNGFSSTFWTYPTAVKNYARFVDLGGGPNANNIVVSRYGSSNDLYIQVYNGATGGTSVRATDAISLNTWQFFAVTVDNIGNVKIYKNGQLVQTGTTTVPQGVWRTENYIGRSNWSADDYFQGSMDDIRLFDYALSTSEVTALYNINMSSQPYDGVPSPLPGLVLAEQFDLGGQGIAYHDTTFGNSGGVFRPNEDVDIRLINDSGSSYAITNIDAGEWLNYTVSIPDPGTYCIYLRASSASGDAPVILKRYTLPTFHAVGVYDEQEVQANAVDYSMAYSNNTTWTSGIGQTLGEDQILTIEEFKPMVEQAFLDGRGGVISFDDTSLATGATLFNASFAGGTKQFTLTSTSGTVHTASNSPDRTHISGDFYLRKESTQHFYFDFSDFAGMGYEKIIAIGATIMGRDNANNPANWRVAAYYTNGVDFGSSSTFRGIDMINGNTTQDSFSGIIAPDGYWITGIKIHSETGSWSGIDDLAFVFDNRPGTMSESVTLMVSGELEETVMGEFTVSSTGSADAFQTFVLNDVVLSASNNEILQMEFPAGGLNVNWLRFEKQAAWAGTPSTLPGKIQAEEYDFGGPNVAYYDTTINNTSGDFRYYENVDVVNIIDSDDDYAVDNMETGEWLRYTVNSTAGHTDVYARIASTQAGGQILVRLDGELLATIDVPNTGSLEAWQTITTSCQPLPEKQNAMLELEFVGTGFRLNWLQFQNRVPYPDGIPHTVPGRIEFEDFDIGGQHISYYDTSENNTYGLYRPDEGVEISTSDDGFAVYAVVGEWLEYTVNVLAGTYDLTVRSAGPFANQQLTLWLDETPLAVLPLNATDGWSDWQTTVIPDVTMPGRQNQILRVTVDNSTIFLDGIEFIRHYNTADLNRSTRVDAEDFAIFAKQWLGSPSEPSADIAEPKNGQVDMQDLLTFCENWLVTE